MARGKIWENILIFSRSVETWKLDGMFARGWRTRGNEKVNEVRGRKGFAVNKDSKTASKTADRWSNAVPVLRKKARSRIAILFEDQGEIVEERPNTPMKNLRVFNLEYRGQGGRAYKVLDEDGYVWDMREDVLLEAMITVGVEPGGVIGGEFVWGNVESQGKLIRVGSQLHEQLNQATTRKKLKKVSTKELVIGGMYRTGSGNIGVFCGFAHSYEGEGKKSKKRQLWFEPYKFGDHTDEAIRTGIQERDDLYRWNVKTSHSFVEKFGQLDLTSIDSFQRVRMLATRQVEQARQSFNRENERRRGWYRSSASLNFGEYVKYQYGFTLLMVTVTPYGEDIVVPDSIKSALDVLAT